MRKHFLILMLMALLPLAGWAIAPKPVTIQCANIEFIYGDDDIPDNNTTAEDYMIGIVSNPEGATIDQIAAALKFQRIGSTSKAVNEFGYSYRLIQDPAYVAGEVDVTITGGNGTLYINKRPITITVDDMSKTFGEENPAFTAGITSGTMLGEEELTYTVVRTSTSENRGVYDYDLTISLTEDEVSANYEITVEKGQFTINPKPLAADKLSITLSQSVYTYTGLACKPTVTVKDADTDEELVLNQDFSVNYYNNTDVPVLPDVTRLKVKAVATGNYTFDNHDEYYTINKAPLTISAQADSKTYGEPNPTAYVPVYTGFVNGETADALVTAGKFTKPTVSRAAGENVGSYDITVAEDAAAANYAITYQNLTAGFEIKQKELNEADFTFGLAGGPYTYDGHAKTPTITTHTYNTYDGTNAVTIVPNAMATPNDYTFVYDNNENAGVNTAQVIITGQGNFKGSIIKTFSIDKADIYIQPANDSKDYSDGDPAYLDGETAAPADKWSLVNIAGEPVEGAALNGTVKLARVAGENVSSYTIYVKSYTAAANDNYEAKNVFNDPNDATTENKIGVFQINPKGNGLVLKFKSDAINTKVYGDSDPVYSINNLEYVSGLVGTDTWESVLPTLSAPLFHIASQSVVNDEQNQVTVTGLASTNYPNVTVQPLNFNVTARPIAVEVQAQTRDFMADLMQGNDDALWIINNDNSWGTDWNGNTTEVKDTLGLTLEYVANRASYAPGSTNVGAIKAVITNPNYSLNDACIWGTLNVNASANFVLSDIDPDLDTKLDAIDGEEYAVMFGDMPIEAQKWYAMVLPFQTTPEELVNTLGTFLIINRISSAEMNATTKQVTVKFGLEWNTIPAGVPFLIKTAKATNWDKTATPGKEFSSREISATIGGETKGDASFLGTYSKDEKLRWGYELNGDAQEGFIYDGANTDWATTTLKYRYLNIDAQEWRNIKNSFHDLKPMEAYLKLNGEALGARIFVEDFENGATAIKSLSADEINGLKTSEGWYTIDGIRLQSAPTQKGIYINNGKKVVVK